MKLRILRFRAISGSMICIMLLAGSVASRAQMSDSVYVNYIGTPQLYQVGDQTTLPLIRLNTSDKIQLNFDDFEGRYKLYYYTYQLCDYNWVPVQFSQFDYIKGFTQNRITTYRNSSVSLQRYTHYTATLPEQNAMPTRSGNYILKVYLDGDTSKLVLTKRFVVADTKAQVAATVVQPMGGAAFRQAQKVRFVVNIGDVNAFSAAQQVKVVILQNNRWDNAMRDIAPTFVRGSVLDYTNDNIAQFPGGKEWRWLDLRNFRVQSDRIDHADYNKQSTTMYVYPDADRSGQRYVYYGDFNGNYAIMTYEFINPFWQGDYATVKFHFTPPGGVPFKNEKLYVAGRFNDYKTSAANEMIYNDSTGLYEGSAFMKQGYYSYTYLLKDADGNVDYMNPLEGNYFETENSYTVLVYYKAFADRTDQLIGYGQVNSLNNRQPLRL